MDDERTNEVLACGECGCTLECCAFCDGEECPKAICYGCVIVAVGQQIGQPHSHGG